MHGSNTCAHALLALSERPQLNAWYEAATTSAATGLVGKAACCFRDHIR